MGYPLAVAPELFHVELVIDSDDTRIFLGREACISLYVSNTDERLAVIRASLKSIIDEVGIDIGRPFTMGSK